MRVWIPILALCLAITPLAVIHPVRVKGKSMEPALKDGTLRWALRSWCAGQPKRGQVWLVEGPDGLALKRVIGLPGESVSQLRGDLLVNDRLLDEPYVPRVENEDGGPWLCEKDYFLAGDNRPESHDCRAWGPLPRSALRGRIPGV